MVVFTVGGKGNYSYINSDINKFKCELKINRNAK